MYKILTTAAVATAMATSAFAGGYEEPELEGEVFVEESGSSASSAGGSLGGLGAGPIIGGVVALAAIAALANSDDDTSD